MGPGVDLVRSEGDAGVGECGSAVHDEDRVETDGHDVRDRIGELRQAAQQIDERVPRGRTFARQKPTTLPCRS